MAASAARRPHRHRAEAEQRDGASLDGAVRSQADARNRTGDGEVTVAASELGGAEPASAFPHGEPNGGEQLIGCHRRRPDAVEEIGGCHPTLAVRREHFERSVEGGGHRRVLGRRIGVGERTSDRAPISDLEVADHGRDEREQGHRLGHHGVVLDDGVTGRGPDEQRSVLTLDALQLPDASDVHEMLEPGQAHRQHRHQALTSGDDLGSVTEVLQQRHRLSGGGGHVVLEGRRFHTFQTKGSVRRETWPPWAISGSSDAIS